MDKTAILEAIRDAAKRNGKPPGRMAFEKLTGIKLHDWYGRYWAKWGDALKEAGFGPNEFQTPFEKERVAAAYLALVVELGRLPSSGELRLRANNSPDFPGHTTFRNALGRKPELLRAVLAYAETSKANEDVLSILRSAAAGHDKREDSNEDATTADADRDGFVYLMKSGKFYRIGRTNKLDRRQYEVGVQLPEEYQRVHSIRTDDPSGIEAYWHNRFGEKRMNGDWFRLNASDVRAFKRRKFM